MRRARLLVWGMLVLLFVTVVRAQPAYLPIGVIQGAGDVSPYLNRFVNFRGVVTGRYEDENTRGVVYHTLFVQELPGEGDGDPRTSDGIAVFLGREPRLDIATGAVVVVGGKVTEFFGLTEIDDEGLVVAVESEAGTLPTPMLIDPPADMAAQADYFEPLESMRVAYNGPVVVAGPTHEGCGFAVIGEARAAELPAVRRANGDPVGRVVPVLHPSDLACEDMPQLKAGDRITGMSGVLAYNFDQFKIIYDSAEQLQVEYAPVPPLPILPEFAPEQIVIATLNAEDYFDTTRDTDEMGEPVLTAEELAARRAKVAHVVAHVLRCPTLLALQEVEHAALLDELTAELAGACGFGYQVTHMDGPDARGIDNALLSDGRRVVVDAVSLARMCSPVPTEVRDPAAVCPSGDYPLFGRPPLRIEALIDGQPYTLFVNHFKSKRGGEIETDLERVRQAVVLNELAAERLAADPQARIIALGDFNDTDLSPALSLLTDPAQGGALADAHAALPSRQRYTYNFGGVVEQIDAILLSPSLAAEVGWASILHLNTDYPAGWRYDTSPDRLAFRSSDHDIPVIALGQLPPAPTPTTAATLAPTTAPTLPPTLTAMPPTLQPMAVAISAQPETPQPAPAHDESLGREFPWLPGIGMLVIVVLAGMLVLRARSKT